MSNQSLSASHQVSISHDPMEEHATAGLDQLRAARDGWPSGGAPRQRGRASRESSILPNLDAADLRPVLLAGALGLFAAWIVSGMSESQSSRRRTSASRFGGRYVADREEPRRFRPQPRAWDQSAGTEGRSSREDLSLDAMNP